MNKLKSIVTDKRIMAAAVMALGVTVAVSTFASGGPRAGSSSADYSNHTLEVKAVKVSDGRTGISGIHFNYSCIRTYPVKNYRQQLKAWNEKNNAWKSYPNKKATWNSLSPQAQKKHPEKNPGPRRPEKPGEQPLKEYWNNTPWKSDAGVTGIDGIWNSDASAPLTPTDRKSPAELKALDFKVKCTVTFTTETGDPANENAKYYYIIGGCEKPPTKAIHLGQTDTVETKYGYDPTLRKPRDMRNAPGCTNTPT